jgi:polar amino acid transport system substrate-binding protein
MPMKRVQAATLGILLAIALSHGIVHAQSSDLTSGKELVIATKIAPPFVMKRADGSFYGISIDLWRRIADRMRLNYRFVEQPTVQALVDGTAEGAFDAAIAAMTVTAKRERVVDFTQPFYSTGLGVAVPVNQSRWKSILGVLTSFGFFQAILALIGLSMCVGFVVWLLERRKTEHFSGGTKGLGTGLWWSTIAMTQAGAAQNAPATLPGRIVATAWMIASVVTIAVFTAGITATLTRQELQGAVHSMDDLRSIRVGAPAASETSEFLDRQRMSHRTFATPQDGLKALRAGDIDAFVYDKPLLTWLVMRDFSNTLRILELTFDNQNYAIALPKGSPLRQELDAQVLDEVESERWQQTLFEYLGKRQSN